MHFEFILEDASSARSLELLKDQILGPGHTANIHAYRGGGRDIPNAKSKIDPRKRVFFDRLPALIKGYGRTFQGRGTGYAAALVIVCDLDDRDKRAFLKELTAALDSADPKPRACICLAVEEHEAWYLGDIDAICQAYPKAKRKILNSYVNDEICGTWELLADALYEGKSTALKRAGWWYVGREKYRWAERISPLMDVQRNLSPSFNYLCATLRKTALDN